MNRADSAPAFVGSPAAASPRRRALGFSDLRLVLIVLTLAHLGLRLIMIFGRRGPVIFADETGYLTNSRLLAGGLAGTLQEAAFYRGGYSLFLLPATWLGQTPLAEFRWALATNALLSALVVPLLYVVLRHVFHVAAPLALISAGVAGLYPPLVITTQLAWTESLMMLIAMVLILLIGIRGSSSQAAFCLSAARGAVAGLAYTVHGRSVVLGAVLILVLACSLVVRPAGDARRRAGLLLITLTTLGLSIWLGTKLNAYLLSASYGGRTTGGDIDRVLQNAADPASAASVVALGAGQYWYLIVATFGVASLGVAELLVRVVRDARSRRLSESTASALFILLSILGLAILVGLFLRPATRPDHIVYGRYIEIFAPILMAMGIVRAAQAPWSRVMLTLGVAFASATAAMAVFTAYSNGLVGTSPVNWLTVLALPSLAQPQNRIVPLTALLASALGAAVVLFMLRRRPQYAVAILAGAMLISAVVVRVQIISPRDQNIYGNASGDLRSVAGLVEADLVAYDMAYYRPIGLYSFQWQLDRARLVLFDSRSDAIPATQWVFAGADWPQGTKLGATRMWLQEEAGQALWKMP